MRKQNAWERKQRNSHIFEAVKPNSWASLLFPPRRYLWGPGTDQLLAMDTVSGGSFWNSSETHWVLTDHLGTVRDLVDYDGNHVSHKTYDSFGVVQDEGAVSILFGYTGRPVDDATGLQNNLHRWYDPAVGRWLSEDPIGFGGGDANLYRYVGNESTGYVDPSGLVIGDPNATRPKPPVNRTWFQYLFRGFGAGRNTIQGIADRNQAAEQQLRRWVLEFRQHGRTAPSRCEELLIGLNAQLGMGIAPELYVSDEMIGAISSAERAAYATFQERVNGIELAATALPLAIGAAGAKPPNLTPVGAGRRGAFRAAKRRMGIPVAQKPCDVLPNYDRRGRLQPGKVYEFELPAKGGGKKTVRIRDDKGGHFYAPDDVQNRGPHFNDEFGGHYDY